MTATASLTEWQGRVLDSLEKGNRQAKSHIPAGTTGARTALDELAGLGLASREGEGTVSVYMVTETGRAALVGIRRGMGA